MQAVLASLPEKAGARALEIAVVEPELLTLASGSPGALLEHVRLWSSVPEELRERLRRLPETPVDALGLAREVCEQLEGEQQLWLISWWQVVLWRRQLNRVSIERLNSLRQQLLSFVQPRLAWEVALLNLIRTNTA